jgi:hypothetical protein
MKKLSELLIEQADIAEQIKIAIASGRAEALSSVIKIIQDYELTLDDFQGVFEVPKPSRKNDASPVKAVTLGAKKRGRPRKVQLADEVNLE